MASPTHGRSSITFFIVPDRHTYWQPLISKYLGKKSHHPLHLNSWSPFVITPSRQSILATLKRGKFFVGSSKLSTATWQFFSFTSFAVQHGKIYHIFILNLFRDFRLTITGCISTKFSTLSQNALKSKSQYLSLLKMRLVSLFPDLQQLSLKTYHLSTVVILKISNPPAQRLNSLQKQ